jgi:molybdopterin biosynthesis enzyme
VYLGDFRDPSAADEVTGFDHLTPLSEALAVLASCCHEVAPLEMAIADAAERIVATPIFAPAAVPPQAIALADGWAVLAQDTVGASSYAPAVANRPPHRVAYGDPLPAHADAVLPMASVNTRADPIEILSQTAPGEGVRATGGDFAIGEVILAAGTQLRLDHIALLRLAGRDKVSLRIPRVAIIVCGDLAGAAAVGAYIAAMVRQEGAQYCLHHVDMTAPDTLAAAMMQAQADLIIVIGAFEAGVPVVPTLAGMGGALAHGIAMRPGETAACGFRQTPAGESRVPVLCTSARFESMLAAWLLLLRPCLRQLAGSAGLDHGARLPLTRKIVSNPGMSDLVLLRSVTEPDGGRMWQPLATGDIPWAAIAHADAWLLVAPECEGYAAGQDIFAQFL